MTLRTSKEDITLPSLHIADEISLSNNGGDILFDKLDVGNLLSLENKNGDIRGTILGGYDDYHISCEIKKGDSNLPAEKPGGEKSLNVTNNNGDIEIQFAAGIKKTRHTLCGAFFYPLKHTLRYSQSSSDQDLQNPCQQQYRHCR